MQTVKNRNMGLQVLLVILTLGIYIVYWFYQTANELKTVANDSEAQPTLWTIFLFVPVANIYAYYMYSELYAKVCSEKINKWILFILWIFFSPAIWFLVQRDLNKIAVKPA